MSGERKIVVFVQPEFEPSVKWYRRVGPFMLCFWVRPGDVCVGLQFVHGGALILLWPVTFGIVHIERAARTTTLQEPQP